jgi:hypothetical protein
MELQKFIQELDELNVVMDVDHFMLFLNVSLLTIVGAMIISHLQSLKLFIYPSLLIS